HAADLAEVLRRHLRHEVVVDAHDHLAAHLERALRHEVERAAHRALGGVLHRHDAEVAGARLHLAEHLVDGGDRHGVGGEAEVLQRRALAERAARAEVGHGDGALEREARRHDLAEEERHRLGRERAGVAFLDAPQHLRLALRAVRLSDLERADAPRVLGAFVERVEDAIVEAVDLLAQALELAGGARRGGRSAAHGAGRSSGGTARTDRTPGMRAMRATTSGAAALSRSTSVYAISPFDLFTMLWMLRPACAIVVEICPTMLGTLAFAIAMRCGDSRAISTLGKFTAFAIAPSSRNSRSWSTTMSAQFSSASSVEAPRWGSATTPGSPCSRGLGKSHRYACRRFSAIEASTASSSTTAS